MRSQLSLSVVVASMAFLATACSKEIGTVPMQGPGSSEAAVTVAGGKKLGLWTKLDVQHTGNMSARFEVELLQDGEVVDKASCDPFDVNVKVNATELTLNDKRSIKYTGKMKCELTPKKAGAAMVRATLSYPEKPRSIVVADFSLLVKE